MDIATLDGFLAAIVCCPKTIMASEWLRWVWDMDKGEDVPEFKDEAEAQRSQERQIAHELHVITPANLHKTAPQGLIALHFYEFAIG
jgi:uncharacterized protein